MLCITGSAVAMIGWFKAVIGWFKMQTVDSQQIDVKRGELRERRVEHGVRGRVAEQDGLEWCGRQRVEPAGRPSVAARGGGRLPHPRVLGEGHQGQRQEPHLSPEHHRSAEHHQAAAPQAHILRQLPPQPLWPHPSRRRRGHHGPVRHHQRQAPLQAQVIPHLHYILWKMSLEIDRALNLALKSLISELSKSNELSRFAGSLQRRRQYDQCEKEYIENQRLRNELGTEYESSDSEEEKENHYNKMPRYELKRLMRRNLVDRRFDEAVLAPLPDPKEKDNDNDELTTVRLISDEPLSSADIRTPTELNIIEEAKEIVEEEQERESSFALEFLIGELERIEKAGLA